MSSLDLVSRLGISGPPLLIFPWRRDSSRFFGHASHAKSAEDLIANPACHSCRHMFFQPHFLAVRPPHPPYAIGMNSILFTLFQPNMIRDYKRYPAATGSKKWARMPFVSSFLLLFCSAQYFPARVLEPIQRF